MRSVCKYSKGVSTEKGKELFTVLGWRENDNTIKERKMCTKLIRKHWVTVFSDTVELNFPWEVFESLKSGTGHKKKKMCYRK
jgi:hypothetical protein